VQVDIPLNIALSEQGK